MAYVALSRVQQMEQVYITKFDPSKIGCDENALNKMERLRNIQVETYPSWHGEETSIKLAILNIR